MESYVDSGGPWVVGWSSKKLEGCLKRLEGLKIQQKKSMEFIKLVGPNVEIRVFKLL